MKRHFYKIRIILGVAAVCCPVLLAACLAHPVWASGFSFRITEYYTESQSIFLKFLVESDAELPGVLAPPESDLQVVLGVVEGYSFCEEWIGAYRIVDGRQLDECSYEGVMRLDVKEEIPENFEVELTISEVRFEYLNKEKDAYQQEIFPVEKCEFKLPVHRSK